MQHYMERRSNNSWFYQCSSYCFACFSNYYYCTGCSSSCYIFRNHYCKKYYNRLQQYGNSIYGYNKFFTNNNIRCKPQCLQWYYLCKFAVFGNNRLAVSIQHYMGCRSNNSWFYQCSSYCFACFSNYYYCTGCSSSCYIFRNHYCKKYYNRLQQYGYRIYGYD